MKALFLFICSAVFSFNINNMNLQENVIIERDETVSVDEVFKIIKEQTDYRFIYPNGLFKNAPKVSLRKGEISVVDLLKHSLSNLNYEIEINENKIIIKEKKKEKSFNKRKFEIRKIEGVVKEEITNQELSYATVRLLGTNYYTITNRDGKFEFNIDKQTKLDSLEVRFLGFEGKKILLSELEENSKIYLTPLVNKIDEVVLLSKKEKKRKNIETAALLFNLINKYRSKNTETKSKVFLSLNSSSRGVPIEHIEGFYNGSHTLAKGITDLEVKSGRFGQNKSFSYYSLDNTQILKNFQFFDKIEGQMLPYYPGNMSLSSIKSSYELDINENCVSCSKSDISIAFIPKKVNPRLFTGEIIFDVKKLIVKKISLMIQDPKTKGLMALEKGHFFTPRFIKMDIIFNPLDLEKIQHVDFRFDMLYTAPTFSELITSNTFLYFYDYNSPYDEPHFSSNIEFRNDYDRIIALQATDEFWNNNYKLPKTYTDKKYMKFMKQHGFIINYDSKIPDDYTEFVRPSVISWDKMKRVNWNVIKHGLLEKEKFNDNEVKEYGKKMKFNSSNQFHSVSEIKKKSYKKVKEKINFSYVFDIYKDKQGNRKLISNTLFDRNTSYSKNKRTRNRLIYINLMFDIYEYYRQDLESQLENLDGIEDEQIKNLFEEKFKEASKKIKKMKRETGFSKNFQELIKWNKQLSSKLGVNNLNQITKIQEQ